MKKNKVVGMFDGNKVVKNTGAKYSELLEGFLGPFLNEIKDMVQFELPESIFNFSVKAWNLANLTLIMNEEGEEMDLTLTEEEDEEVISLLGRMIEHKIAHFKEYTSFIMDIDISQPDGSDAFVIKVLTQESDAFIAKMQDNVEDEIEESDFEPNYIDRHAIVIRPLDPFVQWHDSLYPNHKLIVDGASTYLISEKNSDVERWLRKKFDTIFMLELSGYSTDKKKWPQRRNYKMFKEWFHVETSTTLFDLEYQPVYKG
jgi:hypothetical protein